MRHKLLAISIFLFLCFPEVTTALEPDELVCKLIVKMNGKYIPFEAPEVLAAKYDHQISNWGLNVEMDHSAKGEYSRKVSVAVGDEFRLEITGPDKGELTQEIGITDEGCIKYGITIKIDKKKMKESLGRLYPDRDIFLHTADLNGTTCAYLAERVLVPVTETSLRCMTMPDGREVRLGVRICKAVSELHIYLPGEKSLVKRHFVCKVPFPNPPPCIIQQPCQPVPYHRPFSPRFPFVPFPAPYQMFP